MKRKILFILFIPLFLLTSCYSKNTLKIKNVKLEETQLIELSEVPKPTTTPKPIPTSTPEPKEEIYKLSILAVGDNLIHSPIYKKASNGDGTYDFTPMYKNVKDYISNFDLSIINQETIFIEDDSKISSYPCFGTPIEMGNAIIDTGFDIVLNATNHTWDKKEEGVLDTLNFWNNYPEITILGIHPDLEDASKIEIIEKNNFKLALFNYTYGLNGFILPEGKEYMVDLLEDKDKFLNDVKNIKNDVDFTICFLHIGTEYVYEPTDYQKEYIDDLIDAGADIIICSHPHVIEPYGMIETENGNSALVYYSCGNFISSQDEIPRVLGGMAEINLVKTIKGNDTKLKIENYDFIPTVTHYNSSEHCVYLLEDYTEELANTHYLKKKGFSLEKLWELWNEILRIKIE